MKKTIRLAYESAMTNAKSALARDDLDAAFAALERAHVLGQRHLVPHLVTHAHMLRIGVRRRDAGESVGQVMRLTATIPGFLLGWIPKGNTGGANVSALKPMDLPDDLREVLGDFNVWHDVGVRVAIYAVLAGVAVAVLD